MARVRIKKRKGNIKCDRCGTSHTVSAWHRATETGGGRMSHRLPYVRGANIICPACGSTRSSSRVVRTVIEDGVERDGIFVTA